MLLDTLHYKWISRWTDINFRGNKLLCGSIEANEIKWAKYRQSDCVCSSVKSTEFDARQNLLHQPAAQLLAINRSFEPHFTFFFCEPNERSPSPAITFCYGAAWLCCYVSIMCKSEASRSNLLYHEAAGWLYRCEITPMNVLSLFPSCSHIIKI